MTYKTLLASSLVTLLFTQTTYANTNDEYVKWLSQRGAMGCLAHIVFHEANTQTYQQQEKVAVSVLNRSVKNNESICKVVSKPYQYSSYYKAKQTFNKTTETLTERLVLDVFMRSVAGKQNTYNGVTHFHTTSVRVGWDMSKMKYLGRDGDHIFYKEM